MNDATTKTPAENPSGSIEASSQVDLASEIARTMPALDNGGQPSGGATPTFGAFQKPNGRPKGSKDKQPRKPKAKNPFAAPSEVESEKADDASGSELLPSAEVEQERDPEIDREYGECLTDIHLGYYDGKAEPVLAIAKRKLPAHTVDSLASKRVASERTVANIKKGWAGISRVLNLPAGGADALGFLHACRALHTQQMAFLDELRATLDKLPDLTPENSAQK